MSKIRFVFAIVMGKLSGVALRVLGKKIPYYPGYIALKFCPKFLDMVKKPKNVIAITGTNGKSTISALLTDFFKQKGYKPMNNNGFNIETGIAAMFLKNIGLFGKLKADVAIMEVDEKTTGKIFKFVKPDYLVCTNLFRDSMRTNGNIDYIISKLKSGIPQTTKLILNADDMILCEIAGNRKSIYYGIESFKDDKKEVNNLICDLIYCPKCGGKLKYNLVRYHHIGKVKCPKCGYENPKCNYSGKIVKNLEVNDGENYSLISDSIFNIYNEMAVIALLRELKFNPDEIESVLSKIKITDSRHTEETICGFNLITNMAKGQNPVACSSVFEYVKNEPSDKIVLLMLDDVTDKRYSSETIAWHYDTDYEFLNDTHIRQIIVGGIRSKDLLIRLLLAGIPRNKLVIVENEYEMYDKIDLGCAKNIYFLHDINACDQMMEIKKQIENYIKENQNEN